MSLTFKLASLVIRTVAKPIGNRIKQSAREHETFRRYCVGFAQGLHRVDMRMRLGILHDAAAQERMHAREAAEAAAKKRQSETPTVKTEAQQKADDAAAADLKEKRSEAPSKPRIRPLSENRAIELGANFLSESFIFGVAVGLLVWDQWRTRRKESTRREGVEDRLDALEEHTRAIIDLKSEVARLKSKYEPLPNPAEESNNGNKTGEATVVSPETRTPPKQRNESSESERSPEKEGKPENTSLAEQSS
ncbi:hypothetical protein QM012_008967 [Aureobasidium pullulans]|uniref:OPA3-domain-containing protein n=1 Tax=Aureobasidium pullulans TaxID=5580 RepID=A0ABR0TJ03_AURPU